ncbi:putative MFS efflux transporter [Aspergillus foveolatus]|uniref:putative MFS efflux transporter n=1 Tax=Aspergillus foveolatus TaxID=210207 RepID=UPI003CCD6046
MKWRLASACLMNFGNGMNDSAPGALIPYIEDDYNIGYAIVSLVFIANAAGFLLAAPCTHTIRAKFGYPRSYALSMGLLAAGYTALACNPPFPVVVAAFFLLGFGMALNIAMNNVFCANMANPTTALGCFSGAYGIGGVVAPLLATAMVSNDTRWTFFYIITLGIASMNLLLSSWAFAGYDENAATPLVSERAPSTDPIATADSETTICRLRHLKTAICSRTTLLGALFIFAYQGAEVAVSGWVVSFLINCRHGDPLRVGYVSAGFWAGITLGRFLLVYPAHLIGEKIAVFIMALGAVGFQLLTWLVPSIIGEAVAVAILGLLLGPVFPCSTAVFVKLLPRRIQLQSLSFVTALGSSGGAVFPFMTGILAQRVGTMVLHPVCLGLYAVMGVSWCSLPRISKRSE